MQLSKPQDTANHQPLPSIGRTSANIMIYVPRIEKDGQQLAVVDNGRHHGVASNKSKFHISTDNVLVDTIMDTILLDPGTIK
jgi:hypothetical protein